MIWTIIQLKEDITVLNNVTKFDKILIRPILLREPMYGLCDVRMDGRTGVTLNCHGEGITIYLGFIEKKSSLR